MDAARTITVRYFAVLRERRGTDSEVVQTSATTAAGLYAELRARHDLGLDSSLVRFAVDGDFVSDDHPLRDGAEVALIPPVAGG